MGPFTPDDPRTVPMDPTPPRLYIVGTPIGNAQDITLRALEVLRYVDVIFCEDTRVTHHLLNTHGIKKPLVPYHDHNERDQIHRIRSHIDRGQSVALVSDAGMPLISDPGHHVVQMCRSESIPFTVIPGPSAVLSALVLSGLPTHRFHFIGFLPTQSKAQSILFSETAFITGTLIFYESAKRLTKTLSLLHTAYGDREAAVVREMTKTFETTQRGTLSTLIHHYTHVDVPRGEIVITVHGHLHQQGERISVPEEAVRELLREFSVKDTASLLARITQFPKDALYAECVRVKHGMDQA